MKKPRTVEPTMLQKRAIDNIMSGKYNSKAEAMRDAGYARVSAKIPSYNLFERKGVQVYLEQINRLYKKQHGKSLPDKVMDVYTEGLDATILSGRNAIEHPDHSTRKKFADQFAEFFGWKQAQQQMPQQMHQYNFFSTPKDKQQEFNRDLKRFLRAKKK